MVKVAVSGGTGGVGRAIVRALDGKHDYIILTRPSSISTLDDQLKAHAVAVNYDDIDGVAHTLEQYGVHTVICAFSLIPEGAGEGQMNLIRAAEKSRVTKRFIPSEFAIPPSEQVQKLIHYERPKLEAQHLLKQTSLEWTLIHCGLFLDYLGLPHYPSYLAPLPMFIDMENNFATILGSGNVPLAFTHSFDVGDLVAAFLNQPEGTWTKGDIFILSESITLNQLVKLAEEAKGIKFEVVRNDLEDLKAGKITELPCHKDSLQTKQYESREQLHKFIQNIGFLIEGGDFSFDGEKNFINKQFPEIKLRTAKEVLSVWRGK